MAFHAAKIGLILESFQELLFLARYSIEYRKTDSDMWKEYTTGGILGFGAAIVLFSIVDCLGAVFDGNKAFTIPIDDKMLPIRGTRTHIYILNSSYFDLGLSKIDLENIYANIRSTLVHSSLLPEGYILVPGNQKLRPFLIGTNHLDQRCYVVNLVGLFTVTEKAVLTFIDDVNSGAIDFEASQVYQNMLKKDVNLEWMKLPDGTPVPKLNWI